MVDGHIVSCFGHGISFAQGGEDGRPERMEIPITVKGHGE